MNKETTKTFTTGEFARRFGVSKDTLFYYDRIGLFQPAGVQENGYRYYTVPQLDIFWVIHSLREMKFPLKELKNYTTEPSLEKLVAISQNKVDEIKEEMKKLDQIRWLLEGVVKRTTEACQAVFDQLVLKEWEDEAVLYSQPIRDDQDIDEKKWFDVYDHFLGETGLLGPASVGSVVSRENLLAGRYGRLSNLFVRMESDKSQVRKGGLYAVWYHKGAFPSYIKVYDALLLELAEKGYSIGGDAYEEYLLDELGVQDKKDFVIRISVPVKAVR